MYCPHCDKEISGDSKFCSKCGKAVKKSSPLVIRILGWIFLIGILPTVIFLIYRSNLPTDDKQVNSLFVTTFYLYFLVPLIAFQLWVKKIPAAKQRWFSLLRLVVAGVWLVGFFFIKSQFEYWRSAQKLPQIQEYLVETTAAKLMGDSIYAGHPVKGISWVSISSSAEKAGQGLTDISTLALAFRLDNYRQVYSNWSNDVVAAAKNTNTWKKLPAQPADFKLSLNDAVVKDWFKTTIQNIQTLKEFGDTAIKNKDKTTMFYIAAKLLVQKHWLNGILHAQKVNVLSFNLVDKVMARACAPGEPSVRPEDCDPGTGTCTPHCTYEQPKIPTQPPVQQAPPVVNQNPVLPTEVPETPTPTPEEYSYSPETRDVCIRQTSGSYCAQAAIQSVTEIAASAIGFAEDQPNAQTEWDDSWHNLETTAGISPGEPTTPATSNAEHSPRVQTFYDSCTAKGGYVGGANQDKGRLPTTESGYHCNYKQGVNNCWDFLTYSGGRFMGGDVGCQEKNLVPIAPNPIPQMPNQQPAQQPAQPATQTKPSATQTKSGKWDGTYVGNERGCNNTEVMYVHVKNNQVTYLGNTSTPTAGEASGNPIGSDGHAVSKYTDNEGGNYITNFQFTMKGNVATVVSDSTYNGPATSCGPFHGEGTRQ